VKVNTACRDLAGSYQVMSHTRALTHCLTHVNSVIARVRYLIADRRKHNFNIIPELV